MCSLRWKVGDIVEYTALYRQWRPHTFDEVVGQDHIIRILRNQIINDRISHAYLFCGSRGTGKTSTAKIFARAINCESPMDGSPCGKCDACIELSSENNMDILEIDAASNNRVEEMRELLDKVKYPPAIGRYKVYIIDEAHMLTIGAFNALLKTLEEPPGHVVFILATTEPHKIPATILSRCQRYDFKRISIRVIMDRLKKIGQDMKVDIEPEALETIARWAEGGMRDAISLLDQCMAFSDGVVTNDGVLAILGTADQTFIFQFVENIMKGQLSSLLKQVDLLIEDSRDISIFVRDLIYHLRNLLLVKVCDEPEKLLDLSESTIARYQNQAQYASEPRLIRAIEILSALESELKWNSQPRIMLEMALVKITRPEQEDSFEALLDRISVLEEKLAKGVVVSSAQSQSPQQHSQEDNKAIEEFSDVDGLAKREQEKQDGKSVDKTDSKEVKQGGQGEAEELEQSQEELTAEQKDISKLWPDILKTIKKDRIAIYSLLRNTRIEDTGKGLVYLVFPPEEGFYAAAIERENNRKYIEELIMEFADREVRLSCRTEDDTATEIAEDISIQIDKEKDTGEDIVKQAIDLFGEDFVEVVEE